MTPQDPSPQRRWSPRATWLAVSGTGATLLGAAATWWLWLRPGAQPKDHGPGEEPTDAASTSPGSGDAASDPPVVPSAETDGGDDSGSGNPADGGEGLSCDGPECNEPSCDGPNCDAACDSLSDDVCGSAVDSCADSGTTGCTSAATGQLFTTAVSSAVVLPLVAVDKLTPRQRGAAARLPAHGAVAVIGLYRRFLSPYTRTRCRYVPSCSAYGAAVIGRHGIRSGSRLALRRIRRCTKTVPLGTPDPPS